MNCKNCKASPCSLAGKNHEMSFECKRFTGKTNADRIRAMTDEELSEWISSNCTGDGYGNSAAEWLEWLKSPVEVDNGT